MERKLLKSLLKNTNQKIVINTGTLKELTKGGKALKIEVKKMSDNSVSLKEKTAFNFTLNGKQPMLKNKRAVDSSIHCRQG